MHVFKFVQFVRGSSRYLWSFLPIFIPQMWLMKSRLHKTTSRTNWPQQVIGLSRGASDKPLRLPLPATLHIRPKLPKVGLTFWPVAKTSFLFRPASKKLNSVTKPIYTEIGIAPKQTERNSVILTRFKKKSFLLGVKCLNTRLSRISWSADASRFVIVSVDCWFW